MRTNRAYMANLAGRRRYFVGTKPHGLNLESGYFR